MLILTFCHADVANGRLYQEVPSLVKMNPKANPPKRSFQQCCRKIRCNKAHTCHNRSKPQLECIFPGPGCAPWRKKRTLKAEIISRLKRLEDEVKELRESTVETDRVNLCACSENAVVSENAAGG